MIHAWSDCNSYLPIVRELPQFLPVHFVLASTLRKHSGGVASMTRDRGYPDWLVLSPRLLRSGYHSAKYIYMFWLCLASGYV